MTSITTTPDSLQPKAETAAPLFDDWFDSIETAVRERVRGFIEELIGSELDVVLARPRYGRLNVTLETKRFTFGSWMIWHTTPIDIRKVRDVAISAHSNAPELRGLRHKRHRQAGRRYRTINISC